MFRMTLSKQQREYLTQRIQTGSPLELIRILYEAALQSVDTALQALRSGDILEHGRALTKTIEILSELQGALRHDVNREYSSTLAGLYDYMRKQLIRGHSERSEDRLMEVSRLLQTLAEGWAGAMDKLNAEPEQPASTADGTAAEPALTAENPYSETPEGRGLRMRSWQL